MVLNRYHKSLVLHRLLNFWYYVTSLFAAQHTLLQAHQTRCTQGTRWLKQRLSVSLKSLNNFIELTKKYAPWWLLTTIILAVVHWKPTWWSWDALPGSGGCQSSRCTRTHRMGYLPSWDFWQRSQSIPVQKHISWTTLSGRTLMRATYLTTEW